MFSKQGQFCFGLSREQRKITKLPWEELLFDSSFICHFSEMINVLSKIIPRWCIAGTFPWKVHAQINILAFVTWWIFQLDCIMFFFPWRLEKIFITPLRFQEVCLQSDLHQTCKRDLIQIWKSCDLVYKSRSQTKPFSGVQNCSVHHQTVRVWFFVSIYKLYSKM